MSKLECALPTAYHLHKHGDVIEVEHGGLFLSLVDESNPIESTNQAIDLALLFQASCREAPNSPVNNHHDHSATTSRRYRPWLYTRHHYSPGNQLPHHR
jgi:hypothetical protein